MSRFPMRNCLQSAAPLVSRRCANGLAIPDLGCDRVVALSRGASSEAAAAAARRKDRLLRGDESEIRGARLRPSQAQASARQAMLRLLRFLCHRGSGSRHGVRLSAHRRRDFCRLRFFRANPLAATSCPAAAHLIPFRIVSARPAPARRGWKETHTGGFHEISICDHSGPGAGRHSERDFAFG